MKKKVPRHVARVFCKGCVPDRSDGQLVGCPDGCIGCGACVSACRLNAVSISSTGVAVVDESKCVGCGLCIKACPQKIIQKVIRDHPFTPLCSNREKGPKARLTCANSCIACGICVKNCPMGAMSLQENHAVIDERLCSDCSFCLVRCPRNVIVDARGLIVRKGGMS